MANISMKDGLKAGLGWSIGTALGGLAIALFTKAATPVVEKVGTKLVSMIGKLKNDTDATQQKFEEAK